MNKEKMLMIENFLNSGITEILLEDVSPSMFENAIVLESNCDISELNGHYEGIEFCPPSWYKKLLSIEDKPILIINNINKIPSIEQTKFIEIIKYKKISTFDLPKNCLMIVTCSNLKEHKVNEEIYSLMAHI